MIAVIDDHRAVLLVLIQEPRPVRSIRGPLHEVSERLTEHFCRSLISDAGGLVQHGARGVHGGLDLICGMFINIRVRYALALAGL